MKQQYIYMYMYILYTPKQKMILQLKPKDTSWMIICWANMDTYRILFRNPFYFIPFKPNTTLADYDYVEILSMCWIRIYRTHVYMTTYRIERTTFPNIPQMYMYERISNRTSP